MEEAAAKAFDQLHIKINPIAKNIAPTTFAPGNPISAIFKKQNPPIDIAIPAIKLLINTLK